MGGQWEVLLVSGGRVGVLGQGGDLHHASTSVWNTSVHDVPLEMLYPVLLDRQGTLED